MPRTGIQVSDAAAIDIVDFQSTYVPGDTILGYVVTKQAFAENKADVEKTYVRLKLFGRAKSKIIRKTPHSSSMYRGRAVLFQEEQCIFRGAVKADAKIPFAITIPETSVPGFEQRGDTWDKENVEIKCDNLPEVYPTSAMQYLSTTQEDVTKHKLPSVYYFAETSPWSGSRFQAFVEYVLEATLVCPGASDVTATFPLLVRRPSTKKPIEGEDYKFHIQDELKTIRTELLLPENSERKMTLREMSRRLFTPAKTPRYTYTVKVAYPQVIQLEHPEPVPFKIYIVPSLKHELTSICPGGDIRYLPPVQFVSMKLRLESLARLRCQSTFSTTSADRKFEIPIPFAGPFEQYTFGVPAVVRGNIKDKGNTEYVDVGFPGGAVLDEKYAFSHSLAGPTFLQTEFLRPAEEGKVVPPGPIEHSRFVPREDGDFFLGAPFDLGSHLDIRFTQSGSATIGDLEVPFEQPLYPSFATYNIAQNYKMIWDITLVCAGEQHVVSGQADVEILPPSEEQEARRKRELGTKGMKKNYDDLMEAAGLASDALDLLGNILQVI